MVLSLHHSHFLPYPRHHLLTPWDLLQDPFPKFLLRDSHKKKWWFITTKASITTVRINGFPTTVASLDFTSSSSTRTWTQFLCRPCQITPLL